MLHTKAQTRCQFFCLLLNLSLAWKQPELFGQQMQTDLNYQRLPFPPIRDKALVTEKDSPSCVMDAGPYYQHLKAADFESVSLYEDQQQSSLPPLKPFLDRSNRPHSECAILVCTRSSSPSRAELLPRKLLELRGMLQSAPEMCSWRTVHNRIIGLKCSALKTPNLTWHSPIG